MRDGIQPVKEEIEEATFTTKWSAPGRTMANGGGADDPIEQALHDRQDECLSCDPW